MRVKPGVLIAVLVLVGIAVAAWIYQHQHSEAVNMNERGGPYDTGILNCKVKGGNNVCEIKLKDIIDAGDQCEFDAQGNLKEPRHKHVHQKFAIHVKDGEELEVLPYGSQHQKVRFRGFIPLSNALHPGGAGCTEPFGSASVTSDFGPVRTGLPAGNLPDGCVYELAVQSNEEIENDQKGDHPHDPKNGNRPFFCVDPHFEMIN